MPYSRTVGADGDNKPDDVQEVQAFLNVWRNDNGLALIDEDGVVGSITVDAINGFQAARGGNGDGQIFVVDCSDCDGGIALEPLGASDGVQGQGDGAGQKEACEAARADCAAQANCPPGTLQIGKCYCWRGGESGWTCTVKCGCSSPVA
ncbi:peptidoglycan-binding domain-containing protein [Streptomyces pharetrae]|jgi:peptidoglycan hydrolase-like protein with peptidoglycan-binding domain|uniref:peptidoglycan-binding domain-containing protein n=1 Tax=Streptomyces pharetrae TaxID=291370 RepID=UPI00345F15EF